MEGSSIITKNKRATTMVKSELNVAKNTLQTIINLSSPISNHFSKSLYALIYFVNKSKIIVLNNFQ